MYVVYIYYSKFIIISTVDYNYILISLKTHTCTHILISDVNQNVFL